MGSVPTMGACFSFFRISGVPQGSVVGPLLFLIYVNDLPNCVKSNIHLYPDDCVLFREVTNNNDMHALQSDLDNISTWCENWLMNLNIAKCKAMRITRTSSAIPSYFIKGQQLGVVNNYRYLGVHISDNLTWNVHIDHIINNANRTLGYIRRNFPLAPSSLKLLLYKTLVRTKLEYGAAIWDPDQTYLINRLEMVQNNSARFILSNFHRTASISSMKASLNLPDLVTRRKIKRLCLFHKIFYNPTLSNNLISPPNYVSSRCDHVHKVAIPMSHTRSYACSFIPQTSRDWNGLPAATATIVSNDAFRSVISNQNHSNNYE